MVFTRGMMSWKLPIKTQGIYYNLWLYQKKFSQKTEPFLNLVFWYLFFHKDALY